MPRLVVAVRHDRGNLLVHALRDTHIGTFEFVAFDRLLLVVAVTGGKRETKEKKKCGFHKKSATANDLKLSKYFGRGKRGFNGCGPPPGAVFRNE